MSSLHDVISAWGLPSAMVQKLEAWLSHPARGWHLTDPPDEAFYTIGEEDLVQAGLATVKERRSVLAKLKPAAAAPDHALLEQALRTVADQQKTLEEIKKTNEEISKTAEDRHNTLYQDLLQIKQLMGGTLARSGPHSSEETQKGSSSRGSHPGPSSPMSEDPPEHA